MADYSVNINGPAMRDLRGIYRYFSERLLTPATASRIVQGLEDAIRELSWMPERFRLVDDNAVLASMGFRRMIVKKYIVFFIIEEAENKVSVERIIHGARDWHRILSEEQ